MTGEFASSVKQMAAKVSLTFHVLDDFMMHSADNVLMQLAVLEPVVPMALLGLFC